MTTTKTHEPDTNEEPSLGTGSIFIPEVRKKQIAYNKLIHFTHSSTKAAILMLIAAIIALVVANTPLCEPFEAFWETEVGFVFGNTVAGLSLGEVINDIFMAIFFLLVGLEIKYEMTVGELTNIRQALLPILAACGGVLFPILIYSIFNASNPLTGHGWGVPTATDIAFAIGIMALLRDHVPNGVRVFLSTLAVADDIIAIFIIAVFYGQSPSFFWLGMAALVLGILIFFNRRRVMSLAPYLLVGIVLWYCVYRSGIHATIAGVMLAFTIPTGSHVDMKRFLRWSNRKLNEASAIYKEDEHVMGQEKFIKTAKSLSTVARQVIPPATRLEQKLYPWVYFGILPLFALTNADVSLLSTDIGAVISSTAFLGVFFGLLVGKPLGITLASLIVVKTGLAKLPANTTWIHMIGAGILGGVGFTMAIFVANLSFTDPVLIATAKVGILSASLLAGIIGFLFLFIQAQRTKKAGQAYVIAGATDALQSSDGESLEHAKAILELAGDAKAKEEAEAAEREGRTVEVLVQFASATKASDVKATEANASGANASGANASGTKATESNASGVNSSGTNASGSQKE